LSFFIGFSWELIAWKFLLGIDSFLGKYFGKSWKILENLSRFRRGGSFFLRALGSKKAEESTVEKFIHFVEKNYKIQIT
jgi:hypothetical protein